MKVAMATELYAHYNRKDPFTRVGTVPTARIGKRKEKIRGDSNHAI